MLTPGRGRQTSRNRKRTSQSSDSRKKLTGDREKDMAKSRATLLAGSIILAFSLSAWSLHSQSKPEAAISPAVPDVIGIRPGMSAQEAYTLLKARHPGIKIGVGQSQIAGLGDKPIPTEIAAQ